MKLSGKITRTIATAAIVGMLAAPTLATTTIQGNLLAGNGYGPGDQDSNNGLGDCDSAAVQFTTDNSLLLAKGGGGNGHGGENGGNRSGDQDGDQDRDRDRDGDCQA